MVTAVAGFALCGFTAVELFDVTVLTTPFAHLGDGAGAGLLGLGLLVWDVALPVPASLLMTGLGARYGFLPALLLSWSGGIGATVAVVAGTSHRLSAGRTLAAAAAGGLPAAAVYSAAGAYATGTGSGVLVFALVLLLSGALWAAARTRAATSDDER